MSLNASGDTLRGAAVGKILGIVILAIFFLQWRLAQPPVVVDSPLETAVHNISSWDFLTRQSTKLPDVVELPSKNKPFVFFHNRKCGGSTLRLSIFDAALSHNLTNEELWIPCHGGVPCVEFENIPRVSRRSIYASHINYEDVVRARRQMNLRRFKNTLYHGHTVLSNGDNSTFYHLNDGRHHFDCLTNVRDTVSRVVSCYNYRFLQGRPKPWHMPQPDEMKDVDWSVLLPQAYDRYAGGCNNEMARTFGSLNDETIINTLTTSSLYFERELRHASERMSQCIIVNLDRCEDSNTVLRYYLPWLGNGLDVCTKRVNTGKIPHKPTTLQNGSAEAILALNEFDELMFQFGMKLFEEQLQNARIHLYNQTK